MTFPRTILVTSNCATAGIALGLKALLPEATIKVAPITEINQMTPEQVSERLEGVDLWVAIPQTPEVMAQTGDTPLLRIPKILFNAYHPDIIYAAGKPGQMMGGALGQDYHSAIALWAYNQGLSRLQTVALFCPDTYEGLGYTRRWSRAVHELSDLFADSDLDFKDFYPAVLEHAPFMHTLNHPRSEVIGHLAKQIAVSITGNQALMKLPLGRIVQDILALDSYWPVYPGIAEAYGLDGHYIWKFRGDKFLNGVQAFVDASFDAYASQDTSTWRTPALDQDLFDYALKLRVTP